MQRREALKSLVLIATATAASIYRPAFAGSSAKVFRGGSPWTGPTPPLPHHIDGSRLLFFTEGEAKLVAAVFDRLIPKDDLSVSASEAGCVAFTDGQLAGPYGNSAPYYKGGPYKEGTPEQGSQSPLTPADYYRRGLPEFEAACKQAHAGKGFAELDADAQDRFLDALEAGKAKLQSIDGQKLFAQWLGNVREGFLADPIYGGNKDMVGWKMIGFPGARYDFRDYLDQIGKPITIEPVSLLGRLTRS